jgi:GlpG protein
MRLICIITDKEHENPYEFSYYLTSQGIENECEAAADQSCRIWVYEEDQMDKAQELYREFQANPTDPRYRAHYENAIRVQQAKFNQAQAVEGQPAKRSYTKRLLSPAPYGPISILILLIVIALFLWAQIQRGVWMPPKVPGIVQAPMLAPVEQVLIFDYPTYFSLRDRLFQLYTKEEIEQKKPPSPEAQKLIQQLRKMPVWMGFYDRFITHYRNPDIPLGYHGPLFERIGKGEVWRLFTPALLHLDLLHIFFNVLWFILLGNQIEFRLGAFRYTLLILITGVAANVAQYLMSGPFFMGLSGIIVGMAVFIFARQQIAPWEGYLLHRLTLIFLAIFVIGIFLLQIVFFFMQILGKFELTIGIANTAHLVGGVVGYLLGRMRLFAIHPKK